MERGENDDSSTLMSRNSIKNLHSPRNGLQTCTHVGRGFWMKFISSCVWDTSEIFEFIMRITLFFFRMSAIMVAKGW